MFDYYHHEDNFYWSRSELRQTLCRSFLYQTTDHSTSSVDPLWRYD